MKKKLTKIFLMTMLLSAIMEKLHAQPQPPISFDIDKFKNLLIAAIKFTATIAIIIIFAFSILRGLKGGIEYQAPGGYLTLGVREILDAFKKPVISIIILLLLVWLPDLLVYLGVIPSAPFTINWNELFGGG